MLCNEEFLSVQVPIPAESLTSLLLQEGGYGDGGDEDDEDDDDDVDDVDDADDDDVDDADDDDEEEEASSSGVASSSGEITSPDEPFW